MKKLKKWLLCGATIPAVALPVLSAKGCIAELAEKLYKHQNDKKYVDTPPVNTNTDTPSTLPEFNEGVKTPDKLNVVANSWITTKDWTSKVDNNEYVFNNYDLLMVLQQNAGPNVVSFDTDNAIFIEPINHLYFSGIRKYYDLVLQLILKDTPDLAYKAYKELTQIDTNKTFIDLKNYNDPNNKAKLKRNNSDYYKFKTTNLKTIANAYTINLKKFVKNGQLPFANGNEPYKTFTDTTLSEYTSWNNYNKTIEDRDDSNANTNLERVFELSSNWYNLTERHFLLNRLNHKNKVLRLNKNWNKTFSGDLIDQEEQEFNEYFNANPKYSLNKKNDKTVGSLPPEIQFSEDFSQPYTPHNHYFMSFFDSPMFLAIMNSNINAKSLNMLNDWIYFNIFLKEALKDNTKTFAEQIKSANITFKTYDNPTIHYWVTGNQVQEKKPTDFNFNFQQIFTNLKNSVMNVLNPLIYMNRKINGKNMFFADEWKETHCGLDDNVDKSNQRQIYLFALTLLNKVILPLDYLFNDQKTTYENVFKCLRNYDVNELGPELYKEFYSKELGEMEFITGDSEELRKKLAGNRVAQFFNNYFNVSADPNEKTTINLKFNFIEKLNLQAKDFAVSADGRTLADNWYEKMDEQ